MARTTEEKELGIASAPIGNSTNHKDIIGNKVSIRKGLYLIKSSISNKFRGWMKPNKSKIPH